MIAVFRRRREAGSELPGKERKQNALLKRAARQVEDFATALEDLGATVVWAGGDTGGESPVACDAVALPEVSVLTHCRNQQRSSGVDALGEVLAQYGPVQRLPNGADLDAADVVRLGRHILVSLSPSTNQDGFDALTDILTPFGYEVRLTEYSGETSFREAWAFIPPHFALGNPASVKGAAWSDFAVIPVPPSEPQGASTVTLFGTTLISDAAPRTLELLKAAGIAARAQPFAEAEKQGGRIGSMCLLLEPRGTKPPPAGGSGIRSIQIPDLPGPFGPAAQAVVHGGLVHVSPQLPLPAGGQGRTPVTIEEQAEQALKNLGTVLSASGSSFSRVVRVTLHLSDVKHLKHIEPVYARFFDGHRPALAILDNRVLPPGVAVAIDAVAAT